MDKKLSKAQKLKWKNPEYRKHMSEVHKKQKGWSKGLTKETDERVRKASENKERKKKISETLKKLYKEEKRISWNKGKKSSRESRLKLSKTMKELYKKGLRKSNKINSKKEIEFRNKIYKSLEYQLWRTDIFERDDYTCQICGQRGGKLNAHHILPFAKYPDLRIELNNGLTLCIKCHREVHKKC